MDILNFILLKVSVLTSLGERFLSLLMKNGHRLETVRPARVCPSGRMAPGSSPEPGALGWMMDP